jgi:16S rRNA processing protein RimM
MYNIIKIAKILSPHALAGEMRVFSYIEDIQLFTKIPLIIDNNPIKISKIRRINQKIIIKIDGINNISDAEKLNNQEIYANQKDLPHSDDDGFAVHELINVDVYDKNNNHFGQVINIYNFGAGDVIEIKSQEKTELYTFSDENFPEIDIIARKMIINPPEEI